MRNSHDEDIASGARQVEQTEHQVAGLAQGVPESGSENGIEDGPVETELLNMTLSMFATGDQVRVRVGSPYNPANSFEGVFDSAEEANAALLEAGVLDTTQVPDPSGMLGTGIALSSTTAEKLVEAGLKRHHTASM